MPPRGLFARRKLAIVEPPLDSQNRRRDPVHRRRAFPRCPLGSRGASAELSAVVSEKHASGSENVGVPRDLEDPRAIGCSRERPLRIFDQTSGRIGFVTPVSSDRLRNLAL